MLYRECGDFVSLLLKIIETSAFDELFKIQNISLWKTVAPLLAAFILPEGVLFYSRKGKWRYYLTYLLLRKVKKKVKQFLQLVETSQKAKREESENSLEERNNVKPPILYLNFTSKHFSETFSDTAKLLKSQGYSIMVIGEYESSIQESDFVSIPTLLKKEHKSVKAKIRRFQKRINIFRKSDVFKELRKKFPLIWNVFEDNLKQLLFSIFPDIALRIPVANRVIMCLKPQLITGGDDCDYRARIYFLAAHQKDLPTLLIQQGLDSYKTVDFMFLSTDRVAVIGKETYNRFVKMGIDREKIVITGRPDFDNLLIEDTDKEFPEFLKRRKITRYILFTSQPFVPGAFKSPESRRKIIESIYSLASSDMPIVVKPHPGEKIKFHEAYARKYSNAILVSKDADTNQLIRSCEIFMTCSSTTALQALIAEKPVIIINFDNCSEHSPYYNSEATLKVHSPDELNKIIRHVFNNKESLLLKSKKTRDHFIARNVYLSHGKASERVKNIILDMIDAHH